MPNAAAGAAVDTTGADGLFRTLIRTVKGMARVRHAILERVAHTLAPGWAAWDGNQCRVQHHIKCAEDDEGPNTKEAPSTGLSTGTCKATDVDVRSCISTSRTVWTRRLWYDACKAAAVGVRPRV